MHDRIQRDTPQIAGRGIAKSIGGPGMRTLMKREGQQKNNKLNNSNENLVAHGSSDGNTGTRRGRESPMTAVKCLMSLCRYVAMNLFRFLIDSSKQVHSDIKHFTAVIGVPAG